MANEFFEMRDRGVSSEITLQTLAQKFHKSERQISRYVEENAHLIGISIEERQQHREMVKAATDMKLDLNFEPLEARDNLGEIDGLLRVELAKRCNAGDVLKEAQEQWHQSLKAT